MKIEVESPRAIHRSGFKSWIAIPLDVRGEALRALLDWASEAASNQAGEGTELSDVDGTKTFRLLLSDFNGMRGDWIIEYTLNDWDGSNVNGVFLAAQIGGLQ